MPSSEDRSTRLLGRIKSFLTPTTPALVAILLLPVLAVILLWPAANGRPDPVRSLCENNLRQIGLALHMYHDCYLCFPPAFVADEKGWPIHSWRVLILPFLETRDADALDKLYQKYDFSVPWNHANNRFVLEHMPDVFSCPADPDVGKNLTSYFAVFGPNCVFEGTQPNRILDMTDGTSNTAIVGEAIGLHVPWTKPEDVNVSLYTELGQPGGFSRAHLGGAHLLFGDGAVRYIEAYIEPQTLRHIFIRNDGEKVPEF